jgi:hypothetical protein
MHGFTFPCYFVLIPSTARKPSRSWTTLIYPCPSPTTSLNSDRCIQPQGACLGLLTRNWWAGFWIVQSVQYVLDGQGWCSTIKDPAQKMKHHKGTDWRLETGLVKFWDTCFKPMTFFVRELYPNITWGKTIQWFQRYYFQKFKPVQIVHYCNSVCERTLNVSDLWWIL